MNAPTNPKLLTNATEGELIEALGRLYAKDYLANTKPAEVAEFVYDVMQGNGDMFEDCRRENMHDLWQEVHEAFFGALEDAPEVAAIVARKEAEDAACQPPINWSGALDTLRAELAEAEAELANANAKPSKEVHRTNCQNRVRNCQNALEMMIKHAAAAGFDADGTATF